MKGKYSAALALLLLCILLPLTLLLTLGHWLPGLAGIWLPAGTRIAIESRPRVSLHAIEIPDIRYQAGDCTLAHIQSVTLSHPSRWLLHAGDVTLDTACLAKLPPSEPSLAAPRTLAQWQQMLPRSWVVIDRLTLAPWQQYAGGLNLALSREQQTIHYQGKLVNLEASLSGQALSVKQFTLALFDGQKPLALAGDFTMPLVPDGLPVAGSSTAQLYLPQQPGLVNAELNWQQNSGQLIIDSPEQPQPLLDLPWTLTTENLRISDGRWFWPYQGFPLSGRLGLSIDHWQQGLEQAQISGRLNVLTAGAAGKGNVVLTVGPGKLSMINSAMPLQLTGEAKHDDLTLYATLFTQLQGPLDDPQLHFGPGSLLRSQGRLIEDLNIDLIRWPLAGVKLSRKGVDGRLQAILQAHEHQFGAFELHLDGNARDFLPDAGQWQWRYWGKGQFTPMNANWDVAGTGKWQDKTIELSTLSTGFNQLQYGAMQVAAPRLVLDKPIRWVRDPQAPAFTGALSLDAGQTTLSGGSYLPPSTLKFSVSGQEPTAFQFKGDLHAGDIGPVRVNGRWDGERLRAEAWWPRQTLKVFQPLLPKESKIRLDEGTFNAQVAFSAAPGQGFEAGGHGVVKHGSVWTPDNQVAGIDFILPFRYRNGVWDLGTRGPVRLRVAEIDSQAKASNVTADLQGHYPWDDANPLILSNVSVDVLGGQLKMLQLRLPQQDPALLRVENISSSELITAINPKQFTMSGRINGALPIWLNHPQWIIKDGWLSNPGPLTFRMDKDMADAMVKDNIAAGAAINWLRYMEIANSWTSVTLDNLGQLTMKSSITGISQVDGKRSTIRLNYQHQENLFTLWRSLRFGDNLQSWLEQHMALPGARCQPSGTVCKEHQQ
ncbi:YdbH family protein [Shimwellia pseudoproteus]|uniref:YdbH family protein n=1 Tax=Shimwellia pseudoproteus TaxID=570012 RepID=UPI0018EAB86B|nr:YdbH family protein [Shimwellia pseudoproteus]MBJ3816534.1 YdbH family protein [Shimwellia pseudoproteus]